MLLVLSVSLPLWLCTAGSVLCSVMMKLLLYFYLSWYSHQWLQSHPWMTGIAALIFVPQLSLMASCKIHCLIASTSTLWLLCILVYVCMTLLHLWLCTCVVFLHLCLSHDCFCIANPLWRGVVQVCAVSLCYIDGCLTRFFAICVISLLNLS